MSIFKLSFLDSNFFDSNKNLTNNVRTPEDTLEAARQSKNEAGLERLKGSAHYFMGSALAVFITTLSLEIISCMATALTLFSPFTLVIQLFMTVGTTAAVCYYLFNSYVSPLFERGQEHFKKASHFDALVKQLQLT